MSPASYERLVALAARDPRYRALLDRVGSPLIPRDSSLVPPAFRRVPDRINVGVLEPITRLMGGAERVCWDLCRHLDPARFAVAGLVEPSDGPATIAGLCTASDVLVTWGLPDWPDRLPPGRRPAVILTAHGDADWTARGVHRAAEAQALVAVGPNCVATFPEAERHRVRVIPNMTDPARSVATRPRAAVRAAWGVPPDATVALYLARLSGEKRPEVALAAADPGDGLWVVLHGEGDMRGHLEALAARHPGAILAGPVEDVGSALGAADCLVLPSETEGCSLSLLEANLAGLPVIATPVGQYKAHPELARIVPLGCDAATLRAAILADRADPEGTTDRAFRARVHVEELHAPADFAAAWMDVIASVAPPPPPPGAGTLLKRWLGWAGIRATPGCGCAELAAKMDAAGPDWCEANLPTIVRAMRAEADRRGLPFSAWAAEALLRRAIRTARDRAEEYSRGP